MVIGDTGGQVHFLVINESDGFWKAIERTSYWEEEGASGHSGGRAAPFCVLWIRDLDGVIAVVETTSRVQVQTVEEILEELGPTFQKPHIVKDVGGTVVPGATRIKELKERTTLTL
jgi:hypothetical protein